LQIFILNILSSNVFFYDILSSIINYISLILLNHGRFKLNPEGLGVLADRG